MHEIGVVRRGRVLRVARAAFDRWVEAHTEAPRRPRPKSRRDERQLGLFRDR
jgi:hypothetical protein